MKRSKFNLSHHKLLSGNMGPLYPISLVEVLPGDSIQQSTTCMVRFSPLLSPPMHPTHVTIRHFFVPHRLVWEDWEDFITGGPEGTDASAFPTIDMGGSGAAVGSLADYLGVPTGVAGLDVSALPFRGYAQIWNEYFRDQDLQTELVVDETSGVDTTTNTTLMNVAWEKDYFTSARPWEQKGPSITIPIGTQAPVTGIGKRTQVSPLTSGSAFETGASGSRVYAKYTTVGVTTNDDQIRVEEDPNNAGFPGIFADLTGASAVTVTALREALALQRYEEARARFGSRYVEYLRYLGVRSSDARLQRPEYLGGGRYPVQFSEVLQTAEGTDPVGELRGHGIGLARSNRYRRFFEEHGYVFTFMYVKPKTIYMQGLQRHWNRRFKEDFWQSELQHIGQQEVLNKEVYAAHTQPDGVFGYNNRYQEYREQWSSVSGEFRSVLDFWHFARQFTGDPALNAAFVKCVPSEEPFAVPSQDVLYIMAKHSIQARRLVSGSAASYIF